MNKNTILKAFSLPIVLSALLLGLAQCKKDELDDPTEVNTVNITLNVGDNGSSRHTIDTITGDVTFQNGDVIYVGDGSTYIGTLTRADNVFSGTINEPADNTEIYFYFVGGLTPSTTPSAGSTSSFTVDISNQSTKMPVLSCDQATYHTGTTSYSCVLQDQCALVKFTTSSTVLPVHVGGLYTNALIDFENNCITNNGTKGFIDLYKAEFTAQWAVLLPQSDFVDAEGVVGDIGYTISMPAIEAGAFLTGDAAISISSTPNHNRYLQWAAFDLTLDNNDIVTGTLDWPLKVSIADGATVTLDGVTINGTNNDDYSWAGITCLGDATIILKDGTTNTVKGFDEEYPGIQAAKRNGEGEEYTLTISGNGSLTVSSNGAGAGIGCALSSDCGNITISSGTITATSGGCGIGGCCGVSCGDITISGGNITATGDAAGIGGDVWGGCGDITISGGEVTATGGEFEAGIGSGGMGVCGAITISGGTITANGGKNAAGIGSGALGACGAITINGGTIMATGGEGAGGIGSGCEGGCGTVTIDNTVTSVTATKGTGAPNSIGAGGSGEGSSSGTCGTVTIGGTVYWDGSAYQNGGDSYLATSPLVYPAP